MTVDKTGLSVVAGVQDAESGRLVLAQALDLAARLKAQVVVAHVEEVPLAAGVGLPASGMAGPPAIPLQEQVGYGGSVDSDDTWVRELRRQVAEDLNLDDVPCTYRQGVGDPGRVLAELAEETDAYCVVVGSRGEGLLAGIARWFRPSVSRSVLREISIPVLVVPSSADEPEGADPDLP